MFYITKEGRHLKKSREIDELIDDLRTTQGATLSREGCLELADFIDDLQLYISEKDKEIQWLYGKLNQIGDIIERGRNERK